MDVVQMDSKKPGVQISKAVKMQPPVKMLLGAAVLIWYTLPMDQIKKVAVYLPNSDVAQITSKRLL